MLTARDVFDFFASLREVFALSGPGDVSSYVYLFVYALLNIALIVYRRALSIGAIIYFLLLLLIYAAAFFWDGAPSVFMWLYAATAFYVIIPERRRILTPFALMNAFNCLVVIPGAAGGVGNLDLGMFFEEPLDPLLINTLWDLNGMAHTFLLLFCPVFIVFEACLYWRRRKAARERPGRR